MKNAIVVWTTLFVMVLGVTANAELVKVEDFEGIALDTWLNGTTSAGPLGGLWDTDDEGNYHSQRTARVHEESAGGNRFTRMESRSSSFRTVTVSDITNPIAEGETGVMFLRFRSDVYSTVTRLGIDFSFGIHALTGTDPVTRTNGNDPLNYVAGFTVQGDEATGFNISTIDGTALTTTPLPADSWYSVWIVADNGADTFDLYVEAAGAAGDEVGFPSSSPIATGLAFNGGATTDSLMGVIYSNSLDSTGWLDNVVVDDIWWDGSGGLSSKKAHSPVPTNGSTLVELDQILSWSAPDDPNVASVSSYSVYFDPNETKVANGDPSVNVVGSQTGTSYDPFGVGDMPYETTYYWRVDATLQLDYMQDPNTFAGSVWSFTTKPEYLPPVLGDFDNVITTVDLMPATVSSTISGNSRAMTDVTLTLLTDDSKFPVGSGATFTGNIGTDTEPMGELTTTVAGTYKIKLTATDGVTTLEDFAEVVVYTDACQAQKDAPSGWTADYYDRDGNCIVDLSDFAELAKVWLGETIMTAPETYTGPVFYVPALPDGVYDLSIEAESVDPNDPNGVSQFPITDEAGIRIVESEDASGGQVLGFTGGQWAVYQINVPAAGTYDLYVNVGTINAGVVLSFGDDVTPDLYGTATDLPNEDWAVFYATKHELTLPAGDIALRISWSGGANLDWFAIVPQ